MLVSANCWLKVCECAYWQGHPWYGGEIMTFLAALGKRECCNDCLEVAVRQPSLSCRNNGANSNRVAHWSHFSGSPWLYCWLRSALISTVGGDVEKAKKGKAWRGQKWMVSDGAWCLLVTILKVQLTKKWFVPNLCDLIWLSFVKHKRRNLETFAKLSLVFCS